MAGLAAAALVVLVVPEWAGQLTDSIGQEVGLEAGLAAVVLAGCAVLLAERGSLAVAAHRQVPVQALSAAAGLAEAAAGGAAVALVVVVVPSWAAGQALGPLAALAAAGQGECGARGAVKALEGRGPEALPALVVAGRAHPVAAVHALRTVAETRALEQGVGMAAAAAARGTLAGQAAGGALGAAVVGAVVVEPGRTPLAIAQSFVQPEVRLAGQALLVVAVGAVRGARQALLEEHLLPRAAGRAVLAPAGVAPQRQASCAGQAIVRLSPEALQTARVAGPALPLLLECGRWAVLAALVVVVLEASHAGRALRALAAGQAGEGALRTSGLLVAEVGSGLAAG